MSRYISDLNADVAMSARRLVAGRTMSDHPLSITWRPRYAGSQADLARWRALRQLVDFRSGLGSVLPQLSHSFSPACTAVQFINFRLDFHVWHCLLATSWAGIEGWGLSRLAVTRRRWDNDEIQGLYQVHVARQRNEVRRERSKL